jgi:hypothetical protein
VEEELQPQPPDFLVLAVAASDVVVASGVVVSKVVVEDIEFPSNLLCFRREYTYLQKKRSLFGLLAEI